MKLLLTGKNKCISRGKHTEVQIYKMSENLKTFATTHLHAENTSCVMSLVRHSTFINIFSVASFLNKLLCGSTSNAKELFSVSLCPLSPFYPISLNNCVQLL